ncbi:hypothetical protein D3C85_1533760 [compost metagenome]
MTGREKAGSSGEPSGNNCLENAIAASITFSGESRGADPALFLLGRIRVIFPALISPLKITKVLCLESRPEGVRFGVRTLCFLRSLKSRPSQLNLSPKPR